MKLTYHPSKSILDNELKDLFQRFWLSLILTVPVLLLSIGIPHFIPTYLSSWLQFILATPIVIWCAWPILEKGRLSIVERHLNMFTLIAIAIILAYIHGVFTLFFPTFFPIVLTINGYLDFLFEIATLITTIFLFEQIFEIYIWEKAKDELHHIKRTSIAIEKFANLVSSYLVIGVLLIALLTFVFGFGLRYGFISAIAVLIIACPRAITLSAPIALFSGMARAAKLGIEIENEACLERLEKVNVLIIDKNCIAAQSASLALKLLRDERIHVVMVTNDDFISAETIANKFGIEAIETEINTQQKREVVKRLRQQNFNVSIVTNINDAGIMLELVTDTDKKSYIRLMKNNLLDLVDAYQLSKKVMSRIRQNLFFAFIYNLICIPLAAGVFYFWTGLIFNPIIAAILMFSCVAFVMLNALRLQTINLLPIHGH